MMETKQIKLVDVNPYLMCTLCSGYIIDAMTIIECLHSFCKTCIYQYLESNKYCPVCDVQVHKTKPLLNVRPDKTFQALIYKIVPGLYKDEIERRRLFYSLNPEPDVNPRPVNVLDQLTAEYPSAILSPSEALPEWISLCLELSDRLPPLAKIVAHGQRCIRTNGGPIKDQRHLLCPAGLAVGHLKKFLRGKFDLCTELRVDIYHSDEILKDIYSLGDIASIYTWRRTEPMKLYYVVYKMVECTAVSFDVEMKVNNEKVIRDLDTPSSTVAKSHSEPDCSAKTCAVLPNNSDTGSTAAKQKKALSKANNDVVSASTASESAVNSKSGICSEFTKSLREGEVSKGLDRSTNDDEKDENGRELKVFAPAFLLLKHELSLCRSGAPSVKSNALECKQIDYPNVFTADQSNVVNSGTFDKMQDVGRLSEKGIVSESSNLCGYDSVDGETVVAATVLLSKATANDIQQRDECVGRVPSEEKCGFEPQLLLSDVENQDQAGKKENRPAKKRSSEIEQLFLDRNATREVRNLYKELALGSDKRGRSAAHLRLRLRPGSVVRRRSIGLNSSRSGKVRGAVASKSYTVRQKLAENNKRK